MGLLKFGAIVMSLLILVNSVLSSPTSAGLTENIQAYETLKKDLKLIHRLIDECTNFDPSKTTRISTESLTTFMSDVAKDIRMSDLRNLLGFAFRNLHLSTDGKTFSSMSVKESCRSFVDTSAGTILSMENMLIKLRRVIEEGMNGKAPTENEKYLYWVTAMLAGHKIEDLDLVDGILIQYDDSIAMSEDQKHTFESELKNSVKKSLRVFIGQKFRLDKSRLVFVADVKKMRRTLTSLFSNQEYNISVKMFEEFEQKWGNYGVFSTNRDLNIKINHEGEILDFSELKHYLEGLAEHWKRRNQWTPREGEK